MLHNGNQPHRYNNSCNHCVHCSAVDHISNHDPDHGGAYTVKRYRSEKRPEAEGGWRHTEIRLLSTNPDYPPIVLDPSHADEVRVVAELVAVLGRNRG